MKNIIDHILQGPHFLGLLCYIGGAISITWVHIYFKEQVVDGLKGENKKWEAPEWIVYLASWIFPHMLMSSGFLEMKFPIEAWLFMGALVLFGLTGRWGLEWLLAVKNGTVIKQETKIEKTTEIRNNDAG